MKRNSGFFLVVFLIVGFLLGLNIAGAAASGLDCGQDYWWGKTCGTKVMPCDGDVVFLLKELQGPRIVVSTHGTVYLDVKNDSVRISAGDIRLTWYHEYYPPNSRVNETSGDNGDFIRDELQKKGLIKYLDINYNGKYDLSDPVYIDQPDDPIGRGIVSRGDIRLTDVPPVDVYNGQGQLLYRVGEWGEYRWTVVCGNVYEFDFREKLLPLESGDPEDLFRYMDADRSGDWSFGDRLYIIRPRENFSDFFVTVGDLRLYAPSVTSSSFVSECGTKVEEGDFDSVYVLSKPGDVQLSRYRYGPGEIYLDMDNNSLVTEGDVRLTPVSGHYEPNTKVGRCDYFDLGHELEPLGCGLIKYADLDGLEGYSLGDPLYVDLDWNSAGGGIVSGGDLRLTDVPLFDIISEGKIPLRTGEYGAAWAVVRKFPADKDVGWKLESLPGGALSDILGYLDSDGDGAWSFGDKLYLQQIVGQASHDLLVTVGDLRLCVPDEGGPNIVEARPEFGDKVICGRDTSFSLYPLEVLDSKEGAPGIGYVNRDAEKGFGLMDCAYLDLDGDCRVSDGDVRLTEVICEYRSYGPNTRVMSLHDEDLGQVLISGVRNSEVSRAEGGDSTFGYLCFVDLNSNNRYDPEDPLYLDAGYSVYDKGPSPGDIRLTDVPLKDGPYGPAASVGKAWSRVRSNDPDTNFRYLRGYGQVPFTPLLLLDAVHVFDADCSRTWSQVDAIYLKPSFGMESFDSAGFGGFPPFVTPGDLRLYIPPPAISMYDTDRSGYIEKKEIYCALEDYLWKMIDKPLLLEVITAYLLKTAV